jgi:hypothetical protein
VLTFGLLPLLTIVLGSALAMSSYLGTVIDDVVFMLPAARDTDRDGYVGLPAESGFGVERDQVALHRWRVVA